MQNQYLYHYGVKGMRWGVRKSPEERLKRYTSREIGRIAKRRIKEVDYEDRQIKKRQVRFDRELDKRGGDDGSKKLHKLANKYIRTKAESYARDEIAKKEVERLSSMKYEDMQKEKKAVGKNVVGAVLKTTGSMAVSAALKAPVSLVFLSDPRRTKTNVRVDQATQEELLKKGWGIAANDVYG